MWEFVLFFCVLVLSLLGLTEFLHKVWMLILKPKHKGECFLVVMLKGKDAQQQLNYAKEHLRWCGCECASRLVAIDCGADCDLRQNCNGDCSSCNTTRIYKYNEILDLLKRENVFNDTDSAGQQ